MGRKVNPIAFRLGIIEDWRAKWYANKDKYADLLLEDLDIRKTIRSEMAPAGISKIEIERFPRRVTVTIHTAKPGIIIGRKGVAVKAMRSQLEKLTDKLVKLDVVEVAKPELDAYLVAENIAAQIERRISYRRAMKQAVGRSMRMGAQGIMITCSGRLGGAEMARSVTAREGRVPRHTLRAIIDYATAEALTTFGRIGIKVWIYKGEVLPVSEQEKASLGLTSR